MQNLFKCNGNTVKLNYGKKIALEFGNCYIALYQVRHNILGIYSLYIRNEGNCLFTGCRLASPTRTGRTLD